MFQRVLIPIYFLNYQAYMIPMNVRVPFDELKDRVPELVEGLPFSMNIVKRELACFDYKISEVLETWQV